MAIKEVLVPELSESVAEATLLEWKKQPGEAVEADEILIEVETDKVVLEVPAPASGVLSEIIKGDGSTVLAGEVLARIDTEAQPTAAAADEGDAAAESTESAPQAEGAQAAPQAEGVVAASPAANKILTEKGVDVADVPGSGRDGRVTKADAMAAQPGSTKPAATPAAPTGVSLDGDRKSTRLNSSHVAISYAVFCLKKQKQHERQTLRVHVQ